MVLGADCAARANDQAVSQSLGSHSQGSSLPGGRVWLSPAERYVPLLGRKGSGLLSRRAEWPAGNGDVTALMDSCTPPHPLLPSSLLKSPQSVTGTAVTSCQLALKLDRFRSWGADSSFTVWDSPVLRWPVRVG